MRDEEMAFYTVSETFRETGGTVSNSLVREYTRVFDIEVSEVLGSARVLEQAPGLPRIGEIYLQTGTGDTDEHSFCKSLDIAPREESPYLWLVTARYSSSAGDDQGEGPGGDPAKDKTGGAGVDPAGMPLPDAAPTSPPGQNPSPPPAPIQNPLDRPAKFRWSNKPILRPLQEDLSDPPQRIENSAGALFDPPIEREEARPVLTIHKNFSISAFNGSIIQRWSNRTNSVDWMDFPKWSLRIASIEANTEFEDSKWYWAVTIVMEYKEDLWHPVKILDQGAYYIDGSNNAHTFVDMLGRPMAKGLLDGGGDELGWNLDPVELHFSIYPEDDFEELGLF